MIAVLANKENVPFPDTTPQATTRRQDRNDALLAAKESARIARVKARAFALRLPTHIIRPKPESRHVAEENVAAVAPELTGAPLPYIRDKLVQEGRRCVLVPHTDISIADSVPQHACLPLQHARTFLDLYQLFAPLHRLYPPRLGRYRSVPRPRSHASQNGAADRRSIQNHPVPHTLAGAAFALRCPLIR
jgi:hypothetical protein